MAMSDSGMQSKGDERGCQIQVYGTFRTRDIVAFYTAMPRKLKSRTLAIFLLKEGLTEADEVLKARGSLVEVLVSLGGAELGKLFVQPSAEKPPSWLSLFQNAISLDTSDAYNASTAALWLLEVQERRMALAFGYGRNLLRAGVYDEDFGLRVTLNAVDPNRIKTVDRMTLDAVAQQSRIQASRDANISDFGLDLDVEQDLLVRLQHL